MGILSQWAAAISGVARKKNPALMPLRFTNLGTEDANIEFTSIIGAVLQFRYSTEDPFVNFDYTNDTLSIDGGGGYVELVGDNRDLNSDIGQFHTVKGDNIEVSGSIMTLIYGENITEEEAQVIPHGSTFRQLFKNCTRLTTAPLLPATTLSQACYDEMFAGCTSLRTAPRLPATILEWRCYSLMFKGCTNLTVAPQLPATTLNLACYYEMFMGCTSLTTAPELPATTLTNPGVYYSMFENCTSLEIAPELPATTLFDSCYQQMFKGCSALNYIKCHATDNTANYCTQDWVEGVANSGTFETAGASIWQTGDDGIPTGWTVETIQ